MRELAIFMATWFSTWFLLLFVADTAFSAPANSDWVVGISLVLSLAAAGLAVGMFESRSEGRSVKTFLVTKARTVGLWAVGLIGVVAALALLAFGWNAVASAPWWALVIIFLLIMVLAKQQSK